MKRTFSLFLALCLLVASAGAQGLINPRSIRPMATNQPTRSSAQDLLSRNAKFLSPRKNTSDTQPATDPNLVIDDGTRIVMNVTYWFMGDFIGMAEMRPTTGAPVESVFNQQVNGGGLVYAEGKYYATDWQSGGGQLLRADFNTYNTNPWELESTISLPNQWYSVPICSAYNPIDGKIYSVAYDGHRQVWFANLDTETGLFNYLTPFYEEASALAFDKNGTLYVLTNGGDLSTIDLTTGLCTLVYNLSDYLYYEQSLAFDYHTGELYWLSESNDLICQLKKIDLETGNVEIVETFPIQFTATGMYIKTPEAEEKAPEAVSELSVEFGEKGNKNGTVNLTLPTTCFDGSELTGDVNYTVSVDGVSVKTATAKAGEKVSFSHDFATQGEHKVAVVVSNTVGNGPTGTITVYCGSDIPTAATEAILTVTDDGTATLTWTAPQTGEHGGYVDPAQMTYTITRKPGDVVVAENISETTFTETLPITLDRYSYSIVAHFDGQTGTAAESNSVVYGSMIPPVVDQEVGDEMFFNLCTVIDNDGDGYTFYPTWGSASCYTGFGQEWQSDDWLITPSFLLDPGVYQYSVTFWSTNSVPSSMRFTMGKAATIEAQTTILKDYESFVYEEGNITFNVYFTIEEAGKYYFGANYYTHSDGTDMPYASVHKISVKQGPSTLAPVQITDVVAAPFELAELKNTITFTTPTKAFDGSTLTSLTKVVILDDTKTEVGAVENVEPGKQYSFIDENAKQGVNKYYIYACNEAGGNGGETEFSVYTGEDLAFAVTDVKLSVEDNTKATLTWDYPPTIGQNGCYVNPENVTFNICRSELDYVEPFLVEGGAGVTERKWTFEECGPDSYYGTAQNMYFYGIVPVNSVGEGQMGIMPVVLGAPYEAPFKETFENGYNTTKFWSTSVMQGNSSWMCSSVSNDPNILPYDNDFGMMVYQHNEDKLSQAAFITPIIALTDMKNPVLSFWMYHTDATDDSYISAQISKNDENYEFLEEYAIMLNNGTTGWQQHVISLEKYNGENRLFIAFLGAITNASSILAIDNIEIYDNLTTDLAISNLVTPDAIAINESGAFKATIFNKGREAVNAYEIEVYANGELVATESFNSVQPSASTDVTINVSPSVVLSGKNVNYELRIKLDGDQNDLNDKVSGTVLIKPSKLPAPSSVSYQESANAVNLSWAEPVTPEFKETTDSFEEYEAFSVGNFGEWINIDNDKQLSAAISGVEYPNSQIAKGFQVWKPEGLNVNKDWATNTGSQCLICFAAYGMYPDFTFAEKPLNDDWLISPRVVGGTTVKFFASESSSQYGSEKFEFMISYGSNAIEDFSVVETIEVTEIAWKEYSFELPADARYFAIHAITENNFALLIDDITYTPGYSDLELMGYNVYRNDVKLNEEVIVDMTYIDNELPTEDVVYGITAVYDQGESDMTTVSFMSGVNSIENNQTKVWAEKGCIMVENADGMFVQIFNIAGQKLVEVKASGSESFPMLNGSYLVKTNQFVYKVIVK